MSREAPRSLFALALAAAAALAGCTPKIGDACTTSIDCSPQGDRLCDTTQPGGYCTIFSCEPDTCPEGEAACVAFYSKVDPACGPLDDGEWARFERSFCMQTCDDSSDCRDGYECITVVRRSASEAGAANATLVDSQTSAKVCVEKSSQPVASGASEPPAICGGGSGGGGGGGGP